MMSAYALVPLLAIALVSFHVAHADSPRAQFESGVPLDEIVCPAERVLLESPRGMPACAKESSVDRMLERGFAIVMQDPRDGIRGAEPEPVTEAESEPVDETAKEPKLITMTVASPEPFVDDGREYPRALQRLAPPQPMYDKIMAGMDASGVVTGGSGETTISSSDHEKYSINPGVGFYTEDWLPTHIPDGYKLLYGGTTYETWEGGSGREHEEYKAFFRFVPNNFVLHKNVTNHDLDRSKGFWVEAVKTTQPLDEVEDMIEGRKEIMAKPPEWYGGFRDIERDGKPIYAFEGGNPVNPHRSVISWRLADDSYMGVFSYYHTLDEIMPIFESIMR